MKRFAIILSCEEYNNKNNYPNVAFADKDAELLYDTLINYCDYAKQDIHIETLTIFNDERKPDDILKDIKSLISKAEPGDSVLFYFAGHGDYDGSESYLVLPYTERSELNTTALPIRDLQNILKNNGLLNISVLDCCHSGYDARGSSDGKFKWIDEIENYKGNGWVTFAACKYNESSYPDKDLQQGIFTYYFAETIKEFSEGELIIPEIFKLKLFDKVRIHCESKGMQQTPTYNSSISGNVSIAQRRITVKEDRVKEKNETENLNEFEVLKSRLNKIKCNITSNSHEGKNKLKEIAILCEKIIREKETSVQNYDCSIEIENLNTVDYIEEDIKKSIIKFVNTKKYKPIHDVRINRIYEKNRNITPGSYLDQMNRLTKSLSGTFGYKDEPEVKKIEYILDQEWDMPESYIKLSIDNNEYMPEGELFIYVCPLKIKAAILGGIKVDNDIKIMEELHISLDECIDEKIPSFIDNIIKVFNSKYYNSLLKQIDYLEWEENL